jgi:hypothetical protein
MCTLLTEDVEILKKDGLNVEELPTGYIFTVVNERGQDIILTKEHCEVIQKIGKIEEIKVVAGRQLRIVVLNPVIGTG